MWVKFSVHDQDSKADNVLVWQATVKADREWVNPFIATSVVAIKLKYPEPRYAVYPEIL